MILPDKYTNPKLTAKAVQDIQTELEKLAWLDYVYPLVKVGRDSDKVVPVCYKNDGSKTIISVYPDSSVGAFSFFEIEGATPIPDDEDNWYEYNLSLTVWFNLEKVYPERKYDDYSYDLIQEVKAKLDAAYCHDYELEERPTEIFEKFPGISEDFQFLTMPYGAFKLKFTIEK